MTRVYFTKSEDFGFDRVLTEGHSGYAEEGSDIVCAAVSSATELMVNMLESFDIDFELEVDEEVPSVHVIVLDGEENRKKKNNVRNILKGYKNYISDLAEAYPEFIEISTEV